jgi:hypothetical protein
MFMVGFFETVREVGQDLEFGKEKQSVVDAPGGKERWKSAARKLCTYFAKW